MEAARFLSLDQFAAEFPEWSPYNYGFDNPILFIDPDGRMPTNGGSSYVVSHVNDDNLTEITQVDVSTKTRSNYDIDGNYIGSTTTTTVSTATNTIDIYGKIISRGGVTTTTSIVSSDASGKSFFYVFIALSEAVFCLRRVPISAALLLWQAAANNPALLHESPFTIDEYSSSFTLRLETSRFDASDEGVFWNRTKSTFKVLWMPARFCKIKKNLKRQK